MSRRGGRTSARFFDPAGARFARPTWPWQLAPAGLATARQLRVAGLRPGGQDIAGQILWRGIGGIRVAYLYRIDQARPKRTATPAQLGALAAALEARQVCPVCHVLRGYVIPRVFGQCLTCAGEVPRARVGRVRTRGGRPAAVSAQEVAA